MSAGVNILQKKVIFSRDATMLGSRSSPNFPHLFVQLMSECLFFDKISWYVPLLIEVPESLLCLGTIPLSCGFTPLSMPLPKTSPPALPTNTEFPVKNGEVVAVTPDPTVGTNTLVDVVYGIDTRATGLDIGVTTACDFLGDDTMVMFGGVEVVGMISWPWILGWTITLLLGCLWTSQSCWERRITRFCFERSVKR